MQHEPRLVRYDEGLTLVGNTLALRGDFTNMLPRLRQGHLNRELLVRAARIKGKQNPTAIDATAGLGEDSLLLAATGFTVTLFERDKIIAALLRDALQRAASVPALEKAVQRMELIEGDSVEGLQSLEFEPDVVFLDPMFPERNKSAAVKKKLQLLQLLEKPCDNEEALLNAAMKARPHKIVIKRPVKGSPLANVKPSYAITGKAVRYDVLVQAGVTPCLR